MATSPLSRITEQQTDRQPQVASRPRAARISRRAAVLLGLFCVLVGAAAGTAIELYQSSHWPGFFAQPFHNEGTHQSPLMLTAPDPSGAQFSAQEAPTDSLFTLYYDAHDGATRLGQAITPAVAVTGGWLQVFSSGALYLPDMSATTTVRSATTPTSASALTLARLVQQGTPDQATGVVSLPLLAFLLSSGSEVSVGASGASLTYADLRAASEPQHRLAAPAWYRPNAPTGATGTFIPEQVQNGVVRGHLVPSGFWTALNDPKVSPDGWAIDFGRPVTEALVAGVPGGSQGQRIVVQLFERGALMQEIGAASAAGASAGAPRAVPVGLDYLRTFGPPELRDRTGNTVWSTGAVTLRALAGATAAAQSSLGGNFPFTLQGSAQWVNGTLWYQATWQTPLRHGTGWLPASAVTNKQPSGVATAGFDALDPGLASYLAGLGNRVGAVAYDETHDITYQYNPGGSFIVASSVKVPIMLALFTKLEAQDRDPNANETYLLTTMIENSNNDSAQALYEEIGDAPGLAAFMAQIHISGVSPSPGTWGWSTITPQAMVNLLTLLQQGKILSPAHRAMALSLMEQVETDQQTGVGSTAPRGSVYAMKDGWVPGPDGLWAVNSSGIVMIGSETYIISVYTADDDQLGDGWAITQHVCGTVAQLLS